MTSASTRQSRRREVDGCVRFERVATRSSRRESPVAALHRRGAVRNDAEVSSHVPEQGRGHGFVKQASSSKEMASSPTAPIDIERLKIR